jgi:uncharacterized membrane protein
MLGIDVIAIIALIVVAWRQQQRLRALQGDVDALRKAVMANREAAASRAAAAAADQQTAPTEGPWSAKVDAFRASAPAPDVAFTEALAAIPPGAPGEVASAEADAAQPETPAGPAAPPPRVPPQPPAPSRQPARPTVETALGTRWAVWVGGLALALGGIFLVRYTIEAGIFGPEVRLILAAAFGIVLVAAGEFIRRTGFRMPVEGLANAYVPGILTAAGAFTLFGAVYAAHAIYGFIGPSTAFTLLGAIGIATILASLIHGQALAGVGILGSYATPILVSSQAPNLWALFGFIAVVLAVAGAIARFRNWSLLMGAAFVGSGLWTLTYMLLAYEPADLSILAFITAVSLAVLAFIWLARRAATDRINFVSIVPAVFVALTAIALFLDPATGNRGLTYSVLFLAAMVAVAVWRPSGLALLHAAGAAVMLVFFRLAFSGTFGINLAGEDVFLEGFDPIDTGQTRMVWAGVALGAVFAGSGLWMARKLAASLERRAAVWAAWGVAVPLVVLASLWVTFGNLDRDIPHALVAALLVVVFAASGELIARAGTPNGGAVWFTFAGAGVALLLALHMGFTPGWTTVLLGAAIVLPALATRYRSYAVLGWLSVGAVIFVLLRFAEDPTIVGAPNLSRTLFFNALLSGYGVPALGAAIAGWLLARTTNGTPRLVMEAAASFFTLIGAAMLVRHAMHGGVIDEGAITLAEQSIYTLIALAGSAILIALDRRAPSPVFHVGSLAVGVVSAAMIVVAHLFTLNPLTTDESTGRIPVLNLLFIAYLLPAIAAGALALYARDKRPRWYVAMLALLGALLAFAYASLSLRRLFQGEHIGAWRDFTQPEMYSYSALWLALGVALLVGGLALRSQVLRYASGALIVIAVLKVFLLDMSELEGVLRALSFIGLGVVLIGIGLFYQRMLRLGLGAAPPSQEPEPAPPAAP